jgi:magnesium chelatase family protein
VARYQGKLSGPLLDRIDLQVEVLAGEARGRADGFARRRAQCRCGRPRVGSAQRQVQRQGEVNAQLEAGRIDEFCVLDEAAPASCAAPPNAWAGAAAACTAA